MRVTYRIVYGALTGYNINCCLTLPPVCACDMLITPNCKIVEREEQLQDCHRHLKSIRLSIQLDIHFTFNYYDRVKWGVIERLK